MSVSRKNVQVGAAALFFFGLCLAVPQCVGAAAADTESGSAASGSAGSAAGPKSPSARTRVARAKTAAVPARAARTAPRPSAAVARSPHRPVVRQPIAAAARRVAAGVQAPAAAPAPPSVTLHNNTGQTIWVYNLTTPGDYSIPSDFQPVEVNNGATAPVVLAVGSGTPGAPQNRIYIVEGATGFTLPVTATSGVDAFNPTAPTVGNSFNNYTFLEYNYYPANGGYQYTFDTSYIDEWSLPVQLQFTKNGANWSGAVDKKIYGFNDFDTVVNQLTAAGAPYSDLVWSGPTPWTPQPPATVSRIIGPDKVWSQQSGQPASNVNMNNAGWVPTSFQDFVQYGAYTNKKKQVVYPFAQNGTKYSAAGNFTFWKNSVNGPATTPYPVALRTASVLDGFPADTNGVYGYFTYPNDEKAGQFTNIPQTVSLDIYVNGSGDGVSDSVISGGQWLYTAPVKGTRLGGSATGPITGTDATDTFFLNHLFRGRNTAPVVDADGAEHDIVAIVPPLWARSHTVDVVDTASFGFNADHTSQYVYEKSTGRLYFDRHPCLPGYTAVLADLAPSTIDPATAIFVL